MRLEHGRRVAWEEGRDFCLGRIWWGLGVFWIGSWFMWLAIERLELEMLGK